MDRLRADLLRFYRPRNSPRMRGTARRRTYADPLAAPLSSLARKSIEAMLLDERG